MPVYLETPSQVAVVPRVDGEGRLVSVMIVNACIDHAPELSLSLRRCRGSAIRWMTPEVGSIALDAAGDDAKRQVTLPSLGPWDLGVVIIE